MPVDASWRRRQAFGRVVSSVGHGNNDDDKQDGVLYKNVVGTYLHGPLLPKNPQLADWLIAHALEQKYGKEVRLEPLDDTEEKAANDYVYHRFVKEN